MNAVLLTDVFQQYWTSVSQLSVSETPNSGDADIRIKWARRAHGDDSPFDGSGGVLAHTFYPTSGETHFDDDETWSDGPTAGKSKAHRGDFR